MIQQIDRQMARKKNSWTRNLLIGCGAVIWVVIVGFAVHSNNMASRNAAPSKSVPVASTESPTNCDGIRAIPKDFAVLEGVPLHEHADAQSAQVSIPFGVDHEIRPVSIDTTMPVREMCRFGQWSFIRILQLPSDIGNGAGWVPTAKLRPVNTDKNGRRIYEASDFEWPEGSAGYRKAILAVANRIMAQNAKCDAINGQSMLFDKDRAGTLIKLACFGETEQIVDFRPEDATNGRDFTPVEPTTQTYAREACENAAKERVNHPSTMDISTLDGQFKTNENGAAIYTTTFTAKNAFNLTLKFNLRCSFMGSNLTAADIQESAE